MIEINLLPEGIRTTEGTPPQRFALYIGSLMLFLGLCFFVMKYIKVLIPDMEHKIAMDNTDKTILQEKQKQVDEITAEIDKLNKKIQDLDDLNLSRVRFARLFDRLSNAVPEGVWFRSFSVAPDSSVSVRYQPAGRRYAIVMNGNAVGASQQERALKLTQLLSNLKKQLNIPPDEFTPPTPTPEDFGFCKFIGARFEQPKVSGFATAPLPTMQNMDPKQLAILNPPKEGADFMVTIVFDMPSAKNAGN
ncbi:MAG TPA: hypothetical protein VKX17_19500 [Planctomycetota bacterium]|nr:hypothetical protein [Planctomycetota bacterium]